MLRLLLTLILVSAFFTAAFAQSHGDAFKSLAAFECAAFAHVAKHDQPGMVKPKEEKRLFNLGLHLARNYVKWIREGRMPKKVIRGNAPDYLTFSLQGPNVDFVAGRIAENAQQRAYKKIRDGAKSYDWTAESGEYASKLYFEGNCHSID